MAARIVAAAQCSLKQCCMWLLFVLFFVVKSTRATPYIFYNREELLYIGRTFRVPITSAFQHSHNILPGIARAPSSTWIVSPNVKHRRRRRERKQKRGCRSGVLARLKRAPNRPPLPSLYVANARSLGNKMDELHLDLSNRTNIRDSSVVIITESWLNPEIPDAAVELAGRSLHRSDRTEDSGKSRGGGLCIYVNKDWCTNSTVIDKYCSPDIELLVVKCRPFYLPREFTVAVVTAVYIPPDADRNSALGHALIAIDKQQNNYPEGIFIVAGDFNHVNLKTVLPSFDQHVKCATRGNNILDCVYSNIKKGYRAFPLTHLGQSDHLSLSLIPAYRPVIKKQKTIVRTVKRWSEDASLQLQDCFERTNWTLFFNQDVNEYAFTVLCYIRSCVENITINTSIRIPPNRKPWMTAEVHVLLRERNTAFKSGDRALYNTSRYNLKKGIKRAKAAYKEKIEGHFTNKDPTRMWQGIQQITNYRGSRESPININASLAEELNHFYTRFETLGSDNGTAPLLADTDPKLMVTVEEVRCSFRSVNTRKAEGPDAIPGRVLKECAYQLADVFADIFNMSLATSTVPTCFKTATIIPVPKQSHVSTLNDYRPVALTPIVAKCFERLVMKHVKSVLPINLDQHQYAYRENRSTEDAIVTVLHKALTHLDKGKTYVRLLFVDYSSAFNTIIPNQLVTKLLDLGLSSSLCMWIKDFLTDRSQTVKLGPHQSSSLYTSTGAPQGCVLSPLLYSIYTYDCISTHPSNTTIKFADDTTVVGEISNNDENAYRDEVDRLTGWCKNNNLTMNVKKTKEMIVDFRRCKESPQPLIINGEEVEKVSCFKFLGILISEDLKWEMNTIAIVKKAQQRLYFLRTLKRNNLSAELLKVFYQCAIESVITYGMTAWYANSTGKDRKSLDRVIRSAEKIIGLPLHRLDDIYTIRCLRRAHNILQDETHPSKHLFSLLPSGRRYRALRARTSRLQNSFIPRAITELNNHVPLPTCQHICTL
ncbi:uncharacterized protein [Paramisgurnus dabryanus]|uniref:uncharacterized protein n=1 Tax=Paramisgurnus dabryanus TaxID=90735 RepID=UPI003CCFB9F7